MVAGYTGLAIEKLEKMTLEGGKVLVRGASGGWQSTCTWRIWWRRH